VFSALTNQTFNFDKNDRLSQSTNPSTPSVYFDADGSTTNFYGTFRYDFEDRLTNLNNGAVTVVYNADGQRVKKVVAGVATLYLVDARNPSGYAQVLEELLFSGGTNLACGYTYGLSLISQRQPGVITNFYGTDGHGSVRFLLSSAGVTTETYAYDAYGNVLASTGTTTNNYRYCGEQFDPDLGTYFLRAPRYLDANIGRFQTMDIYQGTVEEPLSLHKYTYASCDPADKADPSGADAAVVNTGGQLGHTCFIVTIPGGGIRILHFFARGHNGGSTRFQNVQGVVYDRDWIWSQDEPAGLGAYLSTLATNTPSLSDQAWRAMTGYNVVVLAYAVGTAADDRSMLTYLDAISYQTNGGWYSFVAGEECHHASWQWFREYAGWDAPVPVFTTFPTMPGLSAAIAAEVKFPTEVYLTPRAKMPSLRLPPLVTYEMGGFDLISP